MVYCFEQHLSMTMIWFTLTLRSVSWEEILTATDSMLWGSKLSPSEGDALSGADSDAYITGSSQWGRVLQGRLTLHSGASPSTVPEKLNTPWCYETNTKKKTTTNNNMHINLNMSFSHIYKFYIYFKKIICTKVDHRFLFTQLTII